MSVASQKNLLSHKSSQYRYYRTYFFESSGRVKYGDVTMCVDDDEESVTRDYVKVSRQEAQQRYPGSAGGTVEFCGVFFSRPHSSPAAIGTGAWDLILAAEAPRHRAAFYSGLF